MPTHTATTVSYKNYDFTDGDVKPHFTTHGVTTHHVRLVSPLQTGPPAYSTHATNHAKHVAPETNSQGYVAASADTPSVHRPLDGQHHVNVHHGPHHTNATHGNGGVPDSPDYPDEFDDISPDSDSMGHFPNPHGDALPSRYQQHAHPATHAPAPADRAKRLRASANGGPSLRKALMHKIGAGKARTDEFAPKPSLSAALKYSGRTAKAHGSALFTRKEVGIEHYAKGLYSKDARDKIRGSVGRIRDDHDTKRVAGRGRLAGLKARFGTANDRA